MVMFSEVLLCWYYVSMDSSNYQSGWYDILPSLSVDTYWRRSLKSEWNRPAILSTYQFWSGEKFRLWLYCRLAVSSLLFSEKKLYLRNQQHILLVCIAVNTSNALRSSMFLFTKAHIWRKKTYSSWDAGIDPTLFISSFVMFALITSKDLKILLRRLHWFLVLSSKEGQIQRTTKHVQKAHVIRCQIRSAT
jgi:hypothetical protein